MTPDTENLAARIDRDRRDRERDLLALLLLLFWQARQHVYSALRVGVSPFTAASDVLYGAPHAGPGLAPRLAAQLALAEQAGYRRTLLVLPGEVIVNGAEYLVASNWQQQAQQYVGQLTQSLFVRIRQAIGTAHGGPRGLQGAVRQAFAAGGYVDGTDRPWLLATIAERMVNTGYQAGYAAGLARHEVRALLRGFGYVATLDQGTTPICTAYHGVRLPPEHAWWLTHWPQNHWGCRSIVVPLFREFEATPDADLPYVPAPQPGFGAAPMFFAGQVFSPARAA